MNRASTFVQTDMALPVNVYHLEREILIIVPVAGADPSSVDVSLQGDMLTVRAKRELPSELKDIKADVEEIAWGSFSRSIVLPADVVADRADATIERGLITVRVPKSRHGGQVPITIVDE